MKQSALSVEQLSVAYHKKPVLENVSFSVPAGKLIAIVGPNGAGKSTLIKAVLGLVPKLTGEVSFFGKPYKAMVRKIGYVPQRESVDWDFPTNALDVVMMGRYGHLGWFKRPGKEEKQLALHCLQQVGMEQFADRQISQLSGGQQQRVFLARALVQDADLYFMDEPFVGVDAATEKAIVALLNDLRDKGKTVFVVHHDLSTVTQYFDWTILLNSRIFAVGETNQVFTKQLLQQTYGGRLAVLEQDSESTLILN